MYKISIIVPVFNVEDTLQDAFDSIKSQTIGFENLEVIFVDDKSTDGSANLIKEYSNKYDNVKAICLAENSGFAGRPRNIGIENANADYLMFLDPDDIFLEDACDLLYSNITENNLELVSGNYNINRDNEITINNWNIINLKDGESSQVETIEENFNMLLTTPSVWSKIFKKEFILRENIEFLVGVPAQDLVFVSQSLLKAKGIKFINSPVVEYIPRKSGESVTSKKSKSVLAGFIKSYTALYDIAKEHNEDYAWIGPRNLYFWIKQFCLSDLNIKDKVDLLYMANPLFEEFIASDKLRPPEFLNEFLDLIAKRDFINASKLSEKLDIYYDDTILVDNIKKRDIFLLFYGLDIEIGGLAKATFNRANLFSQHGYEVTLLNIDKTKNCRHITQWLHENSHLNNSVNIINIYDYLACKNTLNENRTPTSNNENLITKRIEKSDQSFILNQYTTNLSKNIIKSKHFLDNYYCIKHYFKGNPIKEYFYTNDGFKFLEINQKEDDTSVILNDRLLNTNIKFKDHFELYDYFVSEILLKCENKPFLINENSGIIPNFNNIDSSLAYKIASIHTNPYSGEHHYGSSIRDDFSILKNVNELDYVVVLTEGLKDDLVKEFNINRIKAIPNLIDLSECKIETDNSEKDFNKISIFARLSPEKNISDAIKAFKIVSNEKSDARLEIFGRATTPSEIIEEEKLKSLVYELDLNEKIIFKGHSENVSEEMGDSIATLFTSNFEGLGMVVLESMLNSTPVISYDIHYGPADFISNDENGYLVEQGNIDELAGCILDLLDNPQKSIEMGEKAHEDILKQINEENLFEKWEDVLKETYINSQVLSKKYLIDLAVLNELDKLERVKIKLYKDNHRLYRQNRLLKQQINSKKFDIGNIFRKFK